MARQGQGGPRVLQILLLITSIASSLGLMRELMHCPRKFASCIMRSSCRATLSRISNCFDPETQVSSLGRWMDKRMTIQTRLDEGQHKG
jgi:hypothetical protein